MKIVFIRVCVIMYRLISVNVVFAGRVYVLMMWAHSAVVARPLCTRKVPGSIPGVSSFALVRYYRVQ